MNDLERLAFTGGLSAEAEEAVNRPPEVRSRTEAVRRRRGETR